MMPERKRRCATSCVPSDVWLKTCRNCGLPIYEMPGVSFPGYEILPMDPGPPPLPGETRNAYALRVYGRPYAHERLWPGDGLAEDGP